MSRTLASEPRSLIACRKRTNKVWMHDIQVVTPVADLDLELGVMDAMQGGGGGV